MNVYVQNINPRLFSSLQPALLIFSGSPEQTIGQELAVANLKHSLWTKVNPPYGHERNTIPERDARARLSLGKVSIF